MRVFLDAGSGVANFSGYQLHVEADGGRRGQLLPAGIEVGHRPDSVFAGREDRFEAVNVGRGQMLAGLDRGGILASGAPYLATFIFRATPDALGSFVIDVRHDETAGDQPSWSPRRLIGSPSKGHNPRLFASDPARPSRRQAAEC